MCHCIQLFYYLFLMNCTGSGTEKLMSSFEMQKRFSDICDHAMQNTLDHLHKNLDNLVTNNGMWHKSCYASFTSQQNIKHLVEWHCKTDSYTHQPKPSVSSGQDNSSLTISAVAGVDWKLRIFCQKRTWKHLQQVMTDVVNSSIREIANKDYKLKCLIGINDLIAYEAHYHKSCKVKAER